MTNRVGPGTQRHRQGFLAAVALAGVVLAGCATVLQTRSQSAATASAPASTATSTVTSTASATSASATTTTADPGLAEGIVAGHRTRSELAAAAAPLPVGDLPGWHQVFTDGFDTPVALGGFASSTYRHRWLAYDGFADTHAVGQYDEGLLSVSDGVLDAALQTIDGKPRVTGLVPEVGGAWGGQLYGRYSVRFRSDAAPGYVPAIFLWPDSNTWNDGEVDFVEGIADGYLNSYNHCPGHAVDACSIVTTDQVWPDWHVATLEWTPSGVVASLDGKVVMRSTAVPTAKMHLVLQQMARAGVPATSTPHVQVDWVSIWTYDPTTATASASATAKASS